MQPIEKGQGHIAARPRLMLLLGEQLITDEVAAVSELVKNAFDADAKRVIVKLSNVDDPENGYIVIRDDGHGMTRETVLSSWLELGTLSKAREEDLKPRYSESGKRIYLGEKGLGRLAVHKLGYVTELITKRIDSNVESKLILDWTTFQKNEGFLEDIPVEWEVNTPQVFTDVDKSGTQITIRRLQRQWTPELVAKVQRNVSALKSPFMGLSDFDVNVIVEGKLTAELETVDLVDLVKKATYSFVGDVDEFGRIDCKYAFNRKDLPELTRKKSHKTDIRDPKDFENDRKPFCGGFGFRFYSWDLSSQDQKAVFENRAIYTEMIRPNTGVKVFRDGFRVLPYGNTDNDWLSMDMERVRRFELHLSRNQIIGAIEISSKTNLHLLDKTDREGLIDNDSFRDFLSLVKSTLACFEAERFADRRKLKELTGRTRDLTSDRAIFSRNLVALTNKIMNTGIDAETKLEIRNLISGAREAFDEILAEKEQPLLVAASIGLTYMMPTHEIGRNLHEALKILRNTRESEEAITDKINAVIALLKDTDAIVRGVGRLMQKAVQDEEFDLEKPVKHAVEIMQFRLKRNGIILEIDRRKGAMVRGNEKLITILLINFLDNSFYWLLRKKPEERNIKIIIDSQDNHATVIVSDNGPGFEDFDINIVTLPFFTRKPDGMGLGLYIADRIAKMNGGRLELLAQKEEVGLLSGANIAVVLPTAKR